VLRLRARFCRSEQEVDDPVPVSSGGVQIRGPLHPIRRPIEAGVALAA